MKTKVTLGVRQLAAVLLALAASAEAHAADVQLWKSATSGITYRVSISERRMEAEKVFPPQFESQVAQGAFVRCEYSLKKGAWEGKCVSHLPLRAPNDQPKWCTFRFTSKITLLTLTRIEGESDVWRDEDVDVNRCKIKKSHRQPFEWTLENRPLHDAAAS